MSKIKEIRARLLKNPEQYNNLRFTIAKQIFSLNVSLYFIVYLFTVGGFYFGPFSLDTLAQIRYHLYSLLVISAMFFWYSLAEFMVEKYFPEKKILLFIALAFCFIVGGLAIVAHLGFLS